MRGKRKLRVPAFACLVLVLCSRAYAQDPPLRVLRIAECEADGLQSGEAAALQSLITSYVVELKMFRVINSKGQELALQEAETAVQLGTEKELSPLAADYILSARADLVGSLIVFSMDVTKTSTGETRSVSDTVASENDVILSARRLTRSLFEKQDAAFPSVPAAPSAPLSQVAMNPAPSLALLSGTWKGDKNVDRVTLLPDGRGFAVLASGIRMSLKATIEGSAAIILQNQPNSPDFYHPGLDLKSARIVAQGARPWRWTFTLSADGNRMTGIKESVFVTVNEKGAVSLDNNYFRDAVWTRLYH